ncbi:acyltransferase family protein [Altererythrobacter xixiisoli]|uniref:Acyltransferase family protein n=1 Tax=Croceibacterium xixiisoli TaxID=1476466 RepID=A0A6I4TWQ2_9SPHN|nr:acyltransferase family protein [Croceibacterium xixiisoli]MXO99217.1 acyltransferase family protein [Croceibacterium xixiisoli]
MNTAVAGERQHYWDTLRALLMLLGIPYHVALSYRPGETWIVRSNEGWAPFPQIAEFIHLFRMPAFFLIAGYFAALLLSRRAPALWLKQRFVRLGIPFITSILVLVPIMNLACEFSNLPYSKALSSFLWNSSHSGGYWVRHLWFIIVLLYLSTMMAALSGVIPRLRTGYIAEGFDRLCARHILPALLVLGLVIGLWRAGVLEAFYIAGLNTNLLQQILRLDELILFAPWFLLGFLFQRAPATLKSFTRVSLPMVVLAAVFTVLAFRVAPDLHPATGRLLSTFAILTLTQVVIAAAHYWMDRPSMLVSRFVDAAFVIYLFHMPIITILVWLGQDVPVPTAVKGIGVMAITLALSWGAWLVIARVRLLAWLFNGTEPTLGRHAAGLTTGLARSQNKTKAPALLS